MSTSLQAAYLRLTQAQRASQAAQNRPDVTAIEITSLRVVVNARQQEYDKAVILHQARAMSNEH